MSPAPSLPPVDPPVQPAAGEVQPADEATLEFTDQDDRLVNRLAAARGAIGGMVVGAALWAGLLVAAATMIRK